MNLMEWLKCSGFMLNRNGLVENGSQLFSSFSGGKSHVQDFCQGDGDVSQ